MLGPELSATCLHGSLYRGQRTLEANHASALCDIAGELRRSVLPLCRRADEARSVMRYRRAALGAMAALAVAFAPSAPAQDRALEDFFRDFTADWVRGKPNLATATRYFSGADQDQLERQLTPESAAWRHGRVELARRGLAELRKFDRARM